MATLKRILVPIDFDEHADRVLDFGRTLADACGASLHLLHVVASPLADAEAQRACSAEATDRLASLLNDGDRASRHATATCVAGPPVPTITEYAADHDIDLIVMGTHSHGPSFQMIRGSIAEAVMGMAPCAVLAVKRRDPGVSLPS